MHYIFAARYISCKKTSAIRKSKILINNPWFMRGGDLCKSQTPRVSGNTISGHDKLDPPIFDSAMAVIYVFSPHSTKIVVFRGVTLWKQLLHPYNGNPFYRGKIISEFKWLNITDLVPNGKSWTKNVYETWFTLPVLCCELELDGLFSKSGGFGDSELKSSTIGGGSPVGEDKAVWIPFNVVRRKPILEP